MSRRRQARELILGCLYALQSTEQEPDSIFAAQSTRQTFDAETVAYARRVFEKAAGETARIDAAIKGAASRWDLSRIADVEKNILRAAIAELWYCPDTPAPVIIDEAIELANDYAGADSGRFVNGVLDWVYKHCDEPGKAPDQAEPTPDNKP